MRLNLIWLGAIALLSLASGDALGDIIIDFTTDSNDASAPTATGDLLDGGTLLPDLPLTVDVVEEVVQGLTLTLVSGTSTDAANSVINANAGSFGINSPGGADDSDGFDPSFDESLVISFNFDVFIEEIDLAGITGDERFTVGSVTDIEDSVFDFTNSGASQGLFLAAGDGLLLEATTSSTSNGVGLQTITVAIAAVPEPTSASLLGLIGMGLIARRRR